MKSLEVQNAEATVHESLSNFEHAMDHLVEKVDETREQVRNSFDQFTASALLVVGGYFLGEYVYKKLSTPARSSQKRH